MLFFIQCIDKPNSSALRMANRAAHLEFQKTNGGSVVIGGPMLTEDGQGMLGSVFIAEFPDRAAAEAHVANDPYTKAWLFEAVIIRPFRKVLPMA